MTEEKNQQNFIFYAGSDSKIKIMVLDETIWLNQKEIAELFDSSKSNISEHISSIFNDGELDEISVVRSFRTTASDGKLYNTLYYNLDMIISVGYRISSQKATRFRQWATSVLKEYMLKGFAMDDERLKQGNNLFGKDYFDELLERIREIRASERRFYQKITDLYSQYSIDYDKDSEITKNFFAHAQNKLEYAITKMTSAEIIKERANHNLPNMGLKTWNNQRNNGKITKADVIVAKNYLNTEELSNLNLLVNMFLDHAENLAKRKIVMKMKNWDEKLNEFLKFNEYEVLKDLGSIKSDLAKKLSEDEYEKYKPIQNTIYKSDFDKFVENKNIIKTTIKAKH
jgi:hypothetical protein